MTKYVVVTSNKKVEFLVEAEAKDYQSKNGGTIQVVNEPDPVVNNTRLNDSDEKVWVKTTSTTASEIKRYRPENGESGTILVRYNACDNTTPLTANRYKLIRYKKTFSGTLTLANVTSLYSNNDTGFNAVDVAITGETGDIVFKVTGTGNPVMHTMRTEILSGVLD